MLNIYADDLFNGSFSSHSSASMRGHMPIWDEDGVITILLREMEKQALKRHCYAIAYEVYREANALANTGAASNVTPRLSERLETESSFFSDRLNSNLSYQTLYQLIANKFQAESANFALEVLGIEAGEGLENKIIIAEKLFEEAALRYKMFMMKKKLKNIRERLPYEKRLVLNDVVLQNMEDVFNNQHLVDLNSMLGITDFDEVAILTVRSEGDSAVQYTRRISEILEDNELDVFQEEQQAFYSDLCMDCKISQPYFIPVELEKATKAIEHIYYGYFSENQLPFHRSDNYESDKRLYLYFLKYRADFENYYDKHKWHEVMQNEIIERILKLNDTSPEFSRLFNNAAIDAVLIPYVLLDIVDKMFESAEQEGKRTHSVFLTEAIILRKLTEYMQEHFFDTAVFFSQLFTKLELRCGSKKEYIALFSRLFPAYKLSETNPFLGDIVTQCEETLKIKISSTTLAQSIYDIILSEISSPKKALASTLFWSRFSGKFVQFFLLDPMESDCTNTALIVLQKAMVSLNETIAEGLISENYFQSEKQIYDKLIVDYVATYIHHYWSEPLDEIGIVALIKKTFPSFKRINNILDLSSLMGELLFDLTTREGLIDYLLREASQDLSEDLYHTLVCLMVEGLPGQYSDRNCLPSVSVSFSSTSTRAGESWNEFEAFMHLLGNENALRLHELTMRYCVTQKIPYCSAQEVLLIVQTLKCNIVIEDAELLLARTPSLVHQLFMQYDSNAEAEGAVISMRIEAILNTILHSERLLLPVYGQYLTNGNDLHERELQFLKNNFISILSVLDNHVFITKLFQKVMPMVEDQNVINALCFILKPVSDFNTSEKEFKKLSKLLLFFVNNVVEMRRLGNILCVQISDDYLLSSSVSSKIHSLEIQEDLSLNRKKYSLRSPASLDQISIDLAKIYMAYVKVNQSPRDYPVIFFYRLPSALEREILRCVEVYQGDYEIMRKDCFVSDGRVPRMRSESSWASRAAAYLFVPEPRTTLVTLVGAIKCQSDVLSHARIFPEFFDLVLQGIQNAKRFMEQLHAPSSSQPISVAFLRPASAVYYDPRALLHCDENALIGLFVLGLVFAEIERQEYKKSTASLWWLRGLPLFFADLSSAKTNVKSLATLGIVGSGMLQTRYGSSGKDDPVEIALRVLDEKLKPIRKQTQQVYCDWFKAVYSHEVFDKGMGQLAR